MNLLIISHTAHTLKDGQYYGWGPTIEEINFLTTKFDHITHIAPVVESNLDPPASFSPLNSAVRLVPVRNRGGSSLQAKMNVLLDSFCYLSTIVKEARASSGLIHVRCPANISLIALAVLIFFPKKRKWIKYAGDWRPKSITISNWLQRVIIKSLLRNRTVTINGSSKKEKSFIHQIVNPSFRLSDLAATNQDHIDQKCDVGSVSLLFVGALEQFKRPEIVIKTAEILSNNYPCNLVVVGDGAMMNSLRNLTSQLQLSNQVEFTGWKNRSALSHLYGQAQFILLPSMGEGWPKVISEGMAYGVIPIVSDVSTLRAVLESKGIGKVVSEYTAQSYADAIHVYLNDRGKWRSEAAKAIEFAKEFSFERWWKKLNNYLLRY